MSFSREIYKLNSRLVNRTPLRIVSQIHCLNNNKIEYIPLTNTEERSDECRLSEIYVSTVLRNLPFIFTLLSLFKISKCIQFCKVYARCQLFIICFLQITAIRLIRWFSTGTSALWWYSTWWCYLFFMLSPKTSYSQQCLQDFQSRLVLCLATDRMFLMYQVHKI